jgi:hypothetical protein
METPEIQPCNVLCSMTDLFGAPLTLDELWTENISLCKSVQPFTQSYKPHFKVAIFESQRVSVQPNELPDEWYLNIGRHLPGVSQAIHRAVIELMTVDFLQKCTHSFPSLTCLFSPWQCRQTIYGWDELGLSVYSFVLSDGQTLCLALNDTDASYMVTAPMSGDIRCMATPYLHLDANQIVFLEELDDQVPVERIQIGNRSLDRCDWIRTSREEVFVIPLAANIQTLDDVTDVVERCRETAEVSLLVQKDKEAADVRSQPVVIYPEGACCLISFFVDGADVGSILYRCFSA